MTPERSIRPDVVEMLRYDIAATSVRGRRCLDVGCGHGFGLPHLFSGHATRVFGIDRAGSPTVFADAHALPFQDSSFDFVTCFEVLEHLADPPACLREIVRVLSPQGMLLCSTPIARGPFQSPFHLMEWTEEEFSSLLSRHFAQVHLFRQNPRTFWSRLLRRLWPSPRWSGLYQNGPPAYGQFALCTVPSPTPVLLNSQ